MKLDKNGWGTMEMLLLSGGLLLALIVAIFFISQLYGSLGGAIGNKQYIDLENSLEEAANRYIEDKNVAVNGEYKISYETLNSNGYITRLKDIDGNDCTGYVRITNVDSINHYAAYISCKNYQTLNY